MAFYIILVHLFLFMATTFLVAVQLANGENGNYTACSALYSCGNIRNIGYPFWGEDRPKFCGMPEFKLNCDNNRITSFNVIQNVQLGFSVQSIDTSSHTMEILAGNVSEYCYTYAQDTTNLSLLSTLIPDPIYQWIHLFYGCTNNCASNTHSSVYNCTNFWNLTKGSTAYYFGNNQSVIREMSKSCSCQKNVTFLVDEKGLNELENNSGSLLSIFGKEPIKAQYLSNFTACSNCENSGGKCGSSEDPSYEFICHCADGPQRLVCKEKKIPLLILGLGIGGVILVFVVITAICLRKKKPGFITRKASLNSISSEIEKGSIYFSVPLFSYTQLVEATANFDQTKVLGKGGFGIVYHGKLKDGREVAVKRLYEKSCKRVEQFMNEVELLTRLRHENLVSLYGCTSQHCKELLLVYEFVKNGTLADHLHGEKAKSSLLPWLVRLRIAIETATALSYLHASDIIHRDVKSNNILLDSNFCVKVADFGLSRLFPTDVTHVSTAPQGTPGYLDPEYHQCYQLTDKSDVYSFGVVLIQLISSLPAIDLNRHKQEINLSNYAVNRIRRCAFDELVDPQLGFATDFTVRRMTRMVAELAFQCLQHDKEFRPSMNEALDVLKRIESADYEALLKAENTGNNVEGEVVVNVHTSIPPSLHVDDVAADDQAKLLSDHRLLSSSPVSVVEKWVSRSSTLSH